MSDMVKLNWEQANQGRNPGQWSLLNSCYVKIPLFPSGASKEQATKKRMGVIDAKGFYVGCSVRATGRKLIRKLVAITSTAMIIIEGAEHACRPEDFELV